MVPPRGESCWLLMERIQRRVMKVVEEREAVYGVYISDTHGMCVSVVEREREREEFVCVCVRVSGVGVASNLFC